MEPTNLTRPNEIAARNDAFRASLLSSGPRPIQGRVVATSGVTSEGENFVRRALHTIATFDIFTEENDPYGHHDFGKFEVEGKAVYWKIDLYEDETMEYGAEDPLASSTFCLLTILFPSEY